MNEDLLKKAGRPDRLSTLREIKDQVWAAKKLKPCKKLIADAVTTSGISRLDIEKICRNTESATTIVELQRTFANSLLFYEEDKVITL